MYVNDSDEVLAPDARRATATISGVLNKS